MPDLIYSTIVTIVALLTGAYVDVNGGDAAPYIAVATLSAGYAVRSAVYKVRKPKPSTTSKTKT